MKFKGPDGQEIKLRKVSDADYARVRSLARTPLEVCPTCGGKEEYVVPGVKIFMNGVYVLDGEEHDCDCQLQMALHVRYLLTGIGYQYMALDFFKYEGDAQAKNTILNYVDDWKSYLREGMGVMLSSPTQGVGKTWGAIHIGKEMIKRGQRVAFIDFLNMVQGLIHDETRLEMEAQMRETTFLVLDDVQAGISDLQTSLYANTFESVIRHRTTFNLPTITTTNLTYTEFEVHFPRIASLLASKQIWVKVNGTDYRRSQEAEEAAIVRIEHKERAPIV